MMSRRTLRALALWLWAMACCFTFAPAIAHDVPPSFVMIDIGAQVVDLELQLPLSELGAALQLPLTANPDAVISQHGPQIERYLADRLKMQTPHGQAYAGRVESLDMKSTRNAQWTSNDWLVARFVFRAPAGTTTQAFAIDDTVIVDRVLSHQMLVYVRRDIRNGLIGDKPVLIGTAGFSQTHVAIDGSGGSWWNALRRMFALGMTHIAEGTDHLLFLLALLLPSASIAVDGRWRAGRPLAASVRSMASLLTGFTLGHSISLALCSVGWIRLPTGVVEAAIALSILIASVHAWRPIAVGKEVWIASAFGIVHGLAFAEVMSGLDFDGATWLLSLVGFNLGLEAMQLAVMAVLLPILLWLAATRFGAATRQGGALVAATCAVGWLMERVMGWPNPLNAIVGWFAPPPPWLALSMCCAGTVAFTSLVLRSYGRIGAGRVIEPVSDSRWLSIPGR